MPQRLLIGRGTKQSRNRTGRVAWQVHIGPHNVTVSRCRLDLERNDINVDHQQSFVRAAIRKAVSPSSRVQDSERCSKSEERIVAQPLLEMQVSYRATFASERPLLSLSPGDSFGAPTNARIIRSASAIRSFLISGPSAKPARNPRCGKPRRKPEPQSRLKPNRDSGGAVDGNDSSGPWFFFLNILC